MTMPDTPREDLVVQALTTPSLGAEAALHVLADLYLEEGRRSGLVTAEHHDPDRARRKYLGHVFCDAWRGILGAHSPYDMALRTGSTGPLLEHHCWVLLRHTIPEMAIGWAALLRRSARLLAKERNGWLRWST